MKNSKVILVWNTAWFTQKILSQSKNLFIIQSKNQPQVRYEWMKCYLRVPHAHIRRYNVWIYIFLDQLTNKNVVGNITLGYQGWAWAIYFWLNVLKITNREFVLKAPRKGLMTIRRTGVWLMIFISWAPFVLPSHKFRNLSNAILQVINEK